MQKKNKFGVFYHKKHYIEKKTVFSQPYIPQMTRDEKRDSPLINYFALIRRKSEKEAP